MTFNIGPTAQADATKDICKFTFRNQATEEFANTPKFSFTPDHASADPEICPVCCAEYKQDEELLEILPCGHIFHKSCLVEWQPIYIYCCAFELLLIVLFDDLCFIVLPSIIYCTF